MPDIKGPSRVEVLRVDPLYRGFFCLEEVTARYERFDGRLSEPKRVLHFERGDAVGILLHDPHRDAICLVRQFRYPAWVRQGDGWILEVAAGILEAGETPEATARREATEETGLAVTALAPIATFFPSPGACSERVFLYLGEVDLAGRLAGEAPATWRGGLDEAEDIEVVALPRRLAMTWVAEGRLVDAKALIALYWLEGRLLTGA